MRNQYIVINVQQFYTIKADYMIKSNIKILKINTFLQLIRKLLTKMLIKPKKKKKKKKKKYCQNSNNNNNNKLLKLLDHQAEIR